MDRHAAIAKEVCTDIIQNGIHQQRYRLKKAYWENIKNLTHLQAFALKPANVEEKSWKNLVTTWFDDHYQENCKKNKKNQQGVMQNHTTGSRSYVAHYEWLKNKENS